jgi:hypothetical protein
MSNITDAEIAALTASKSMCEWDEICDAVKKVRGGNYPSDWFAVVMAGGIAAKAKANWGCCGNCSGNC